MSHFQLDADGGCAERARYRAADTPDTSGHSGHGDFGVIR